MTYDHVKINAESTPRDVGLRGVGGGVGESEAFGAASFAYDNNQSIIRSVEKKSRPPSSPTLKKRIPRREPRTSPRAPGSGWIRRVSATDGPTTARGSRVGVAPRGVHAEAVGGGASQAVGPGGPDGARRRCWLASGRAPARARPGGSANPRRRSSPGSPPRPSSASTTAPAAAPEARVPVDPSTATAIVERKPPSYATDVQRPSSAAAVGGEARERTRGSTASTAASSASCCPRSRTRSSIARDGGSVTEHPIEHARPSASASRQGQPGGAVSANGARGGAHARLALSCARVRRGLLGVRQVSLPAADGVSCGSRFSPRSRCWRLRWAPSLRYPRRRPSTGCWRRLGRLGKLGVAANFGREFDSDVKRFRFTSSPFTTSSLAIEMITPLFPKKFLVLATLANIGKSVGITTANVVRRPYRDLSCWRRTWRRWRPRPARGRWSPSTSGLAARGFGHGLTGKVVNDRARLIIPFVAFIPLATMDLCRLPRAQGCAAHDHQQGARGDHMRSLDKPRQGVRAQSGVRRGASVHPGEDGRVHPALSRRRSARGVPDPERSRTRSWVGAERSIEGEGDRLIKESAKASLRAHLRPG